MCQDVSSGSVDFGLIHSDGESDGERKHKHIHKHRRVKHDACMRGYTALYNANITHISWRWSSTHCKGVFVNQGSAMHVVWHLGSVLHNVEIVFIYMMTYSCSLTLPSLPPWGKARARPISQVQVTRCNFIIAEVLNWFKCSHLFIC